jgi:hypothetical protein
VRRDGLTAVAFREQCHEQRQWLLDRGINPGDWSQVYPILKASWQAYGIPSDADRARLRLKVADETPTHDRHRYPRLSSGVRGMQRPWRVPGPAGGGLLSA